MKDTMEGNEKAYNARRKHELITAMSLEELFPDPEVRALAEAAAKGAVARLDKLVRDGADINSRGTEGVTPLFWAMHNIEGFKHLLELGADPNVVFANGDAGTVLSAAVEARDDRFLTVALQHNAKPNLVYNRRYGPVIFLAAGISERKVDMLLAAGADINARNQNGDTPALAEASMGQYEPVYHLLLRGCDSRAKNNYGDDLRSLTAHLVRVADPKNPHVVWLYKVKDWLDAEDAKK